MVVRAATMRKGPTLSLSSGTFLAPHALQSSTAASVNHLVYFKASRRNHPIHVTNERLGTLGHTPRVTTTPVSSLRLALAIDCEDPIPTYVFPMKQ